MSDKKKIYNAIEVLICKSFYDNSGMVELNKFESDCPVRSRCFYNIDNFLMYVKKLQTSVKDMKVKLLRKIYRLAKNCAHINSISYSYNAFRVTS